MLQEGSGERIDCASINPHCLVPFLRPKSDVPRIESDVTRVRTSPEKTDPMSSKLKVCVRIFLLLFKQILPESELTVLTALRLRGLSCGSLSAETLLRRLFYSINLLSSLHGHLPCPDRFPLGKLSTISLHLRLILLCPGKLCAMCTKGTRTACMALVPWLRRKIKGYTGGAFELDEITNVRKACVTGRSVEGVVALVRHDDCGWFLC